MDVEQREIGGEVIKELRSRLQFMLNVGLHYLTLDRPAPSLSGGEGQRIRLASQLGCGLVGVLYILDEPSIGLHPRDHRALLDTLCQLRDQGNTVVVIEHDEQTMRLADWLIDLGPGPGVLGGELVAAGTPDAGRRRPALADRALPERRAAGDGPQRRTTRRAPQGWLTAGRRAAAQPQNDRRPLSAGHLVLRDRGQRLGQEQPGGADAAPRALPGAAPGAQRARPAHAPRRPGADRQGDPHHPAADRPHAALQPGHVRRRDDADPRAVCLAARGQGARLWRGAL